MSNNEQQIRKWVSVNDGISGVNVYKTMEEVNNAFIDKYKHVGKNKCILNSVLSIFELISMFVDYSSYVQAMNAFYEENNKIFIIPPI